MIQPIKPKPDLELEDIHSMVSLRLNIDKQEMFKETRIQRILESRQIFHYVARMLSKQSSESIGAYALKFGRNKPIGHCTVLHSAKKINDFMFNNTNFTNKIQDIIDYCLNNCRIYITVTDVNLLAQAIQNTTDKKNELYEDWEKNN